MLLASKIWSKWRDALRIVKPDTVVRWRRGALSKALGSQVPVQRASEDRTDLADVPCKPAVGRAPNYGELLKLDVNVSEATVSKYMIRDKRPPSQIRRRFLENHRLDIIAVDSLTEATAAFRVLFVLIILSRARRTILRTNATEHPIAVWTARHLLEAIGQFLGSALST